MTSKRRSSIALFCVLAVVASAGRAFAEDCTEASLESPEQFADACVRTALEQPSKLAWVLLSKICDLGAPRGPSSRGAEPQTCEWQTWATNDDTFPAAPREDEPPRWPVRAGVAKPADPKAPCDGNEKLRNRAAFDYIVAGRLWYREGFVEAWNGEPENPQGLKIGFPANAVEVEASWTRLGKDDREGIFHLKMVETENDGVVVCGLTGLDVKVKILPGWLWFTFEHVDNPGRCDYIGCHDSFGQTPADVAPHPATGGVYAPEQLTPALHALVPNLSEVWQHYRLKGTQHEFVRSDGRPTFLGNSQLEGPVVPASSSCITCHAQAGFDREGMNLRGSGFVGPLAVAAYGAPDPQWFYDTAPTRWELRYRQTDFNWAIPLHACPLDCPEDPERRTNKRCAWEEICAVGGSRPAG